jgi:CheY-like chemotaxis protein
LGNQVRILIVEDLEDDVLLLLSRLRRDGFDPISERVDTHEVILQALQKPWNVIISDFILPEFNGLDSLKF